MRSVALWFVAALLAGSVIGHADDGPAVSESYDRAIAVLLDGLMGQEFWPSMHAAEGLVQAGLQHEVIVALAPRLPLETDDQRRCGLARELIRAGREEPVAVLTAILRDSRNNGRIHACESLFKAHRTGDAEALRHALNTDNPVLEIMAAAALAGQGDAEALVQLRRRLGDPEVRYRRTAAWVLGQVGGPEDWDAIRALAESEIDPLSRSFFWNALARLGAPGARDVVKQNLDAEDATIRTYAAEALAECGDAALLPQLETMLADPALDTRIRAAQAIVCIRAGL